MTPTRIDPGLDPFNPECIADPYPLYEDLRRSGPVVFLPSRNIWLVSGYEAVRHVLRHPDAFLSGLGTGYVRADVTGIRGPLIDNDPPDHTRIRRSVQRWFTPSAIEERRAPIRTMVEELVERALMQESVDVVEAFARPLPVAVMADLLGLDHPNAAAVSAMMDSAFHLFGPDPAAEHVARFGDMVTWLLGDGLANLRHGDLGAAIIAGEADPMERVALLASIWIAGVDTSTNLISSALHAFARHPEQWRLLADNPDLAEAAVEEALRYESPIRFFIRRTAGPTDILGVTVPEDADVCVLFASANRDPAHYQEPDRFDIHRGATDHLAFGSGIHLCLGAPLLRLEVTELMRCLATRVRTIELNGDAVRNPSTVIQGFVRVPLRLVSNS